MKRGWRKEIQPEIAARSNTPMKQPEQEIDTIDRKIILATQDGLPLVQHPYRAIAEQVGVGAEELMSRMRRMLATGVIRRIGVVPDHYALGYRANGMSVWDIPDARVDEVGEKIGRLDFVSHCYQRPRRFPDWPYNLFAMVHGRDRIEIEREVETIAQLIGGHGRGHTVLYSTRILKKTGLRMGKQDQRRADERRIESGASTVLSV